jgi:hypothetical protein
LGLDCIQKTFPDKKILCLDRFKALSTAERRIDGIPVFPVPMWIMSFFMASFWTVLELKVDGGCK